MNKTTALSLTLLLAGFGCSSSSDEEVAQSAVEIVGQVTSALATNASLGDQAASTQNEGQVDPQTPGGLDQGCVTSQLQDGGLVVDFGTGCTIFGVTYAGRYTLRLSFAGGFSLSMDFVDYSVNGRVQNGDLSLALTPGQAAAHLDLDIEENGASSELEFDGTILATPADLQLDGSARHAEAGVEATLAVDGVRYEKGDCYPNAGTITVTETGDPTVTITFDADTPATGIVTVTVGSFTGELRLPQSPSCTA